MILFFLQIISAKLFKRFDTWRTSGFQRIKQMDDEIMKPSGGIAVILAKPALLHDIKGGVLKFRLLRWVFHNNFFISGQKKL